MKAFTLTLEADNLAQATITSVSPHAVTIALDPEWTWNAEGLLRLSAALKGAAGVLVGESA
jgi:hypothetical protein